MAANGNYFTRRSFVQVSGAILGGAILTACSQATPPAPTSAPASASNAAPTSAPVQSSGSSSKQQVTIRVNYRVGDDPKAYEKLFPDFEKANPDIALKGEPISFGDYSEYFAKMASLMAAGTLGDIVWVSAGSGPYLSEVFKGFFMPLDDLVKQANYDLGQFYASTLPALSLEGKLYALPSDTHPGVQLVFYNKNAFDDAKVDYPKPDWTFDDIVAMGKKLTKSSSDRVDMFGFGADLLSYAFECIFRGNGTSFISTDGKTTWVDHPEAVSSLQWVDDLMHVHKIAPTRQQIAKTTDDMFVAGQIAMVQSGAWMLTSPAKIGNRFQMDAARMPKGSAGKIGGMVHIGGESMYSKTKYPQQAFRALTFLESKEFALNRAATEGGFVPRKDVFSDPSLLNRPMFAMVKQALDDNPPPYFTPYNFRTSELQSVVDQGTDVFWTGQSSVKEGIPKLKQDIQTVLDKPR